MRGHGYVNRSDQGSRDPREQRQPSARNPLTRGEPAPLVIQLPPDVQAWKPTLHR